MNWREITASWFSESMDDLDQGISSNMKMMLIAAAFLMVTIGLILMQPGRTPQQQQAGFDQPIDAPTAALKSSSFFGGNGAQDVTRANTSLLSLDTSEAFPDVSKMLRRPIRLTGQQDDLRQLTKATLDSFGHTAASDDVLYDLLVQALSERQSNAYIDALLNTAAGRGEFAVPAALQTASGRLDTLTLLQGLAARVTQ